MKTVGRGFDSLGDEATFRVIYDVKMTGKGMDQGIEIFRGKSHTTIIIQRTLQVAYILKMYFKLSITYSSKTWTPFKSLGLF